MFQEVQGGFERLRKAVRAGGKAHQSSVSLTTSSPTPHHLPSPPVSLHASSLPNSNHVLLKNTPLSCSEPPTVFESSKDSTFQSSMSHNRTSCPLAHFMVHMFVLHTCIYIMYVGTCVYMCILFFLSTAGVLYHVLLHTRTYVVSLSLCCCLRF